MAGQAQKRSPPPSLADEHFNPRIRCIFEIVWHYYLKPVDEFQPHLNVAADAYIKKTGWHCSSIRLDDKSKATPPYRRSNCRKGNELLFVGLDPDEQMLYALMSIKYYM
jgi:hypothetical protein